jgi:hypothetical protein
MAKEKTLIEKVKAKRKSAPKSPYKINTEISTGVPKDGAPPFPWTPELESEIADYISNNAMSLKRCVANNSHWPAMNCIYERIHKNPKFGEMYELAKQNQVLTLNEQTLDVVDEMKANPELVPWGREAIRQYNWQAARLKPRRFGDKTFTEVTTISHEASLDVLK